MLPPRFVRRFPAPTVAVGLGLALVGLLTASATAQWTQEELKQQSIGFLEDGQIARLRQIQALLAQIDQAEAAICSSIHGDHREYLLKIERVLDQLTDDRWLAREDAERTLVEIGGNALVQIEARAKGGATLEERIRCLRIRKAISERGTEAEQNATRMLRGWTRAAAYMPPSERLTRALVSALGHTDPLVVEGAVRALGFVGGDEHAAVLRARVTPDGKSLGRAGLRRAAIAALGRLRGDRAAEVAAGLLRSDVLDRNEGVRLLRSLRARADGRTLLTDATQFPDPVVRALAELDRPEAADADPPMARFLLADRTELTKPFLGLDGDELRVAEPVDGLSVGYLPCAECDGIEFDRVVDPVAADQARVFTTQGSLLVGELILADPEAVTIQSMLFGRVVIPREDIQGLAIDPQLDRLVGASNQFDRVRLTNGEFVNGRVRAIDAGKLLIRLDGDEDRSLDLTEVAGVLFRRPETLPQDTGVYTRLDLTTGERLLAYIGWADKDTFGCYVPQFGVASIPTARINSVSFGVGGGALWGFTLIADYSENRVFEVDDQGREVFALEEVFGVWDVECLDNGNLLVTEFALNRIVEVSRTGEEIWQFGKDERGVELKNPYDADRLANGNTLIADTFGRRVIEVSPEGQTVWEYADGIKPYDANRLADGNTLIADGNKDRIIEVNAEGKIVWEKAGLPSVHDVDRLPNGNTLVTQRTAHRVIELDRDGNIVFELENLSSPSDADRLPNGNTLVSENGSLNEYDRRGGLVWQCEVVWAVEANRY